MPRYFMVLAYHGAPFHGWQIQPNATSVQEVVEQQLSLLLRADTKITGAGRTDTGVNASCMVAHFDTIEPIDDCQGVVRRLNTMLGRDITIYAIAPVHADAHARFDATARTYRYFVSDIKTPFFYNLLWQATPSLDYEKMNQAAQLLKNVTDFTSFAKLHTDNKTNICHVTHARWHALDGTGVKYFEITADRFLRNMVRAVVGTLVDVGRGKVSIPQFIDIVEAKNRCRAGTSMPGEALYLWSIEYPYFNVDDYLKTGL